MEELEDMAAMVVRDRHHASVLLWSFCNEVGCNNESAAVLGAGAVFEAAVDELETSTEHVNRAQEEQAMQ